MESRRGRAVEERKGVADLGLVLYARAASRWCHVALERGWGAGLDKRRGVEERFILYVSTGFQVDGRLEERMLANESACPMSCGGFDHTLLFPY